MFSFQSPYSPTFKKKISRRMAEDVSAGLIFLKKKKNERKKLSPLPKSLFKILKCLLFLSDLSPCRLHCNRHHFFHKMQSCKNPNDSKKCTD